MFVKGLCCNTQIGINESTVQILVWGWEMMDYSYYRTQFPDLIRFAFCGQICHLLTSKYLSRKETVKNGKCFKLYNGAFTSSLVPAVGYCGHRN